MHQSVLLELVLSCANYVLSKCPNLSFFALILLLLAVKGNITRQEAVSMIPPLLLDVKPNHNVSLNLHHILLHNSNVVICLFAHEPFLVAFVVNTSYFARFCFLLC